MISLGDIFKNSISKGNLELKGGLAFSNLFPCPVFFIVLILQPSEEVWRKPARTNLIWKLEWSVDNCPSCTRIYEHSFLGVFSGGLLGWLGGCSPNFFSVFPAAISSPAIFSKLNLQLFECCLIHASDCRSLFPFSLYEYPKELDNNEAADCWNCPV